MSNDEPQSNSRWIPRVEYTGQLKAHEDVHKIEKEARIEAARVLEAKMEQLNELRTEVITDRGQYVTRKEIVAWMFAGVSMVMGAMGIASGIVIAMTQ
jgi:ubiquinone biosynthesis protein UbiJ